MPPSSIQYNENPKGFRFFSTRRKHIRTCKTRKRGKRQSDTSWEWASQTNIHYRTWSQHKCKVLNRPGALMHMRARSRIAHTHSHAHTDTHKQRLIPQLFCVNCFDSLDQFLIKQGKMHFKLLLTTLAKTVVETKSTVRLWQVLGKLAMTFSKRRTAGVVLRPPLAVVRLRPIFCLRKLQPCCDEFARLDLVPSFLFSV